MKVRNISVRLANYRKIENIGIMGEFNVGQSIKECTQ